MILAVVSAPGFLHAGGQAGVDFELRARPDPQPRQTSKREAAAVGLVPFVGRAGHVDLRLAQREAGAGEEVLLVAELKPAAGAEFAREVDESAAQFQILRTQVSIGRAAQCAAFHDEVLRRQIVALLPQRSSDEHDLAVAFDEGIAGDGRGGVVHEIKRRAGGEAEGGVIVEVRRRCRAENRPRRCPLAERKCFRAAHPTRRLPCVS